MLIISKLVVMAVQNQAVTEQLKEDGVSLDRLKGLGITNQRETTVVWHRLLFTKCTFLNS